MVKRYVMVRMPIEAYKGFEEKRKKMEARVEKWTGKRPNIKMSNVYRVVAKTPTEIPEGRIIRLVKKKSGGKTNWY